VRARARASCVRSSSTTMAASECKFHRITTLKLPQQAEAQELLEKVAWQVQPIMRKHGWSVPVLAEFLPRNPALLGLNHNKGQKIQVRLRQSKDSGFMPYESALGTTLHELVHCDIGAHSAEFYSKLDALRNECDALEAKSVGGSGSGFDADGQKLSGISHNPMTVRDGRLAAAAAAERRAQKRSLGMGPGGGQRLGGRRPAAALPPAQMAALAATRRSADEQWCSSHLGALEQLPDWLGSVPADSTVARGAAAKSSSSDTGVKVPARNGSAPQAAPVCNEPSTQSGERSTNHATAALPKRGWLSEAPDPISGTLSSARDRFDVTATAVDPSRSGNQAQWSCGQCTLLNPADAMHCSVCNYPDPKRYRQGPGSHGSSTAAPPATTAAAARVIASKSTRAAGAGDRARRPGGTSGSTEVIELLDSDSD
jgi:DNA-dependent metalloprotease WSS1